MHLALLFAAASAVTTVGAVTTVDIVDQDCKLLYGAASTAEVKVEQVKLAGGSKPFTCTRSTGKTFECVSSRSGKTLKMQLARADENILVLEHRGAPGEAGPIAMIVVQLKEQRFTVASIRDVAQSGIATEYCVGAATVK